MQPTFLQDLKTKGTERYLRERSKELGYDSKHTELAQLGIARGLISHLLNYINELEKPKQ